MFSSHSLNLFIKQTERLIKVDVVTLMSLKSIPLADYLHSQGIRIITVYFTAIS